MKLYYSFVLITIQLIEYSKSANILYITTTASPSHVIWDKTLAMALRNRGHNITFYSSIKDKNTVNFTNIIMEGVHELILEDFDLEGLLPSSPIDNVDLLIDWLYSLCHLNLKTDGAKQLEELSKTEIKFDLIIIDMTAGICMYPYIKLFKNPPIIGTVPFGLPPFLSQSFSYDLHISYVPYCATSYSSNMTFIQRLHNFYIHLYELVSTVYLQRKTKAILDERFGQKWTDEVFDVDKKISIMLTNYDFVLDIPRPLPPQVVPVGGLHTKRAKILPEDLQKFVEQSKKGVIIFSLGTNVRSDKLKNDKKNVILEAFSKLEQNVIWKFESDISGLPKNVIVRQFLPQNDLLAHPNVKLLINHGGALSTQEAIYHGVPLITVPFFADQYANTYKVLNRKIGSTLKYQNLTVDYMVKTIKEVIQNPIYKQNIAKISQLHKDLSNNPLERAIFWVEHVLKFGNADHLRSPGRDLPFYQHYLFDIYLFLILLLILGLFILRKIYNYIFHCKSTNKENKLKSE